MTGANGKRTVTTREFVNRPIDRAPKAARGRGVTGRVKAWKRASSDAMATIGAAEESADEVQD